MPMRGAFITLEGTEGVGKSTVCERARDVLVARDQDLVVTREPGGTALGEQVRRWILDAAHAALSAEVETLLMFAARGYHLDTVIRPALDAGKWVLCDRFTDATYAYQGGGRGASRELLDTLTAAVQRSLAPDLTLLLDAPVEVGLARISDRPQDHFERESHDFFERVRTVYLELARRAPQRFRIIDATQPLERVWAQVENELGAFVERFDAADVGNGRGSA